MEAMLAFSPSVIVPRVGLEPVRLSATSSVGTSSRPLPSPSEALQRAGAEPGAPGAAIAPSAVPAGSLEEIERASILRALETTGWNKQAAAALLGLRRPTLYSKMRRHGIPQRRDAAR